jgi:hypothetical protein
MVTFEWTLKKWWSGWRRRRYKSEDAVVRDNFPSKNRRGRHRSGPGAGWQKSRTLACESRSG